MGLVLTRRAGEAILIGDDIVVRIVGKHGGAVRVVVDAPPHIQVDREELRAKRVAETDPLIARMVRGERP